MQEFSKEEIAKLAELAHLEVPETELEGLREDLSKIVEYVNRIEKIDVSGLEPMQHPFDTENVWREDVIQTSLSQEAALANAPQRIGEYFAFPRIVPGKLTESNRSEIEDSE